MFRIPKSRSRGVSIVEILMALAVLVIILSFASPSLSSTSAKAELKTAVENMEYSVRMAKTTARQLESDVVMHFKNNPSEKVHSISYSYPSRNSNLNSVGLLQEYKFPQGVRLITDAKSVHFDYRGMVEKQALLMLVSNHDDDINKKLVIE